MTNSPTKAWQFASRFRRGAFGWRSDAPIRRIKEAVAEIKQAARKDTTLGTEGAVRLLEKLSPALEQVDSSSGAIGTAVNRAIKALVPIIAKPQVADSIRKRWLERLWQAIHDDEIPYIESLGDYWGELCVTPAIASHWADEFLPIVTRVWADRTAYGHFQGTSICLASLYAANRYDELLALLETARFKWWRDRQWGMRALMAMGRKVDALRYAEESRGMNAPMAEISRACEDILLASGLADEAYVRYALEANRGATNLATFRAIVRKHPQKSQETILRDLLALHRGSEGKWFAAAKEAGLFDLAIEAAALSPTDPRTLIRAARDYASERPAFALEGGMAALRWIAEGQGYEITSVDVLDAYTAIIDAAAAGGFSDVDICARVRALADGPDPHRKFIRSTLERKLSA